MLLTEDQEQEKATARCQVCQGTGKRMIKSYEIEDYGTHAQPYIWIKSKESCPACKRKILNNK